MTLLLPGQPAPRPSRLSRGVLADPAGAGPVPVLLLLVHLAG